MAEEVKNETFEVKGEDLVRRVKELIIEGNVRRIIVKDKEGRIVVEFPLTVGVIGTVLAPPLAVIGTLAALISECTIIVERRI